MDPRLWAAIEGLLRDAHEEGEFLLCRISGGRNNQIFVVTAASGQRYCLKCYHCEGEGRSNRLDREFDFLQCAWKKGIRQVPRPIEKDARHRMGLYEFVEGSRPAEAEVDGSLIGQAAAFCRLINGLRDEPAAKALDSACDCCFSVRQHIRSVERRLGHLEELSNTEPWQSHALHLLRNKARPVFDRAVKRLMGSGDELDASLPKQEQGLSPSDFGFHNCLVMPNGSVKFIDFEYAGWDDLAKLVADFFTQPDYVVPLAYFDKASEDIMSVFPDPEPHVRRARLLLPLHRLKWSLIVLNDFLPDGRRRRAFASDNLGGRERLEGQLAKATSILDSIDGYFIA